MGGLRITLTIIFLIAGAILCIVVMMQESKQRGLSATLTGASGVSEEDSYWAKNKGRTVEGKLVIWSRILLIIFLGLGLVLNIKVF